MGIPSNLGTTSTTPGPSTLSQIGGAIGSAGSLGLGFAEGGAVDGEGAGLDGLSAGAGPYWTMPEGGYGISIPMLSYPFFSRPATTEFSAGVPLKGSSLGDGTFVTKPLPPGLLKMFRRLPGLIKTKATGGGVDDDGYDTTPLGTIPEVAVASLSDAPPIAPGNAVAAVQPASIDAVPVAAAPVAASGPSGGAGLVAAAAPPPALPPPDAASTAGLSAWRPQGGGREEPNRLDRFLASPAGAFFQGSLATMAGTSPFAGVNIGAGLLEGVKAYQAQKAATTKLDANAQVLTDGDTIKIFYPSSGEVVDTHIPTGKAVSAPETKTVGNRLYQWSGAAWEPVNTGDPAAEPPYQGTGMDAQNWNIVLTGDPASKEYAAAYNQLFEQPRLTPVQTENGVMMVPQMPVIPPSVRPPAGQAEPATPASVATPSATAPTGDSATAPSVTPGVGTPFTVPGTTPKPTEAQLRNRQLYSVVKPELKTVQDNFKALSVLGNQIAAGALPKSVASFATTAEYQRAQNALRTIIATYLYSTSGATANPGEVENQVSVLMPVAGESDASVQDKLKRIETMVESIRVAGSATGATTEAPAAAPSVPAADAPAVPWEDYFK